MTAQEGMEAMKLAGKAAGSYKPPMAEARGRSARPPPPGRQAARASLEAAASRSAAVAEAIAAARASGP